MKAIQSSFLFSFVLMISLICGFNMHTNAQVYLMNYGGNIYSDSGMVINIEGHLINRSGASIDNNGTIELIGDFTNTSSFDQDSGIVIFNGNRLQNINGDSSTFYFIEMDNIVGVTVGSGVQQVRHSLILKDGVFNTNNSVVLLSDSILTARIPEIPIGASISGDITMERFLDNGVTGWHLLGAATSGGALQEWNDDFTTTGFTGSHYPTFPFNNINTYKEADTSIKDTGYHGATNITNKIDVGVGYWTYIGPVPLTFDSKGPANTFGQSLPVSYTNNKDINHDGWNMVANPYPSNINWNASGWTKINIDNAIYIYDPDNGVYTSYVSGVGTNGGTPYIASSQGFWVKANGNTPILTLTEPVKTDVTTNFYKQKADLSVSPKIRLKVSPETGGVSDETVLVFSPLGEIEWDEEYDAYKLEDNYSPAPYIGTVLGEKDLSINTLPEVANGGSIPLRLKVKKSGTHVIEITRENNINPQNCLYLEDLDNGKITDLKVDSNYKFQIADSVFLPRFLIHTNPMVDLGPDTILLKNKTIELKAGSGYKDYLWSNGAKTPTIKVSEAGSYSVKVWNAFGCVGQDEIKVESDTATSIEEVSDELFRIYPNPAKDFVVIEGVKLDRGDYNIQLYDGLGHLITAKTLMVTQDQFWLRLNTSTLSTGVYTIVVDGPEDRYVEKLVVMK